jgi:hypothetical protein
MRWIACCVMLLCLAACDPRPLTVPELPTLASIDAAATALVQTQNAPPEGFAAVSFPRIDQTLPRLAGWRYEALLEFQGTYARTSRPVSARADVQASYDQVGSARRVQANLETDLDTETLPIAYEGVRLGPDVFLVRGAQCERAETPEAKAAVELGVGDLLGGIKTATSLGEKAVINNAQVWRYELTPDALDLPVVGRSDDSRFANLRGELWVAPDSNAIMRYYLTMDVENVTLFASPLPVTGTLTLQYDLYDVGRVPNISVPFGC